MAGLLRVCATSGCPSLTDETRCEQHRKAKRKREDKRRPNARARGYDERWQQTRRDFLRAFPICQDERGCIEAATDVDHIDGEGPKEPRGHDWANLRSLCHRHHSQRTATDQPGGWNA